MDWKVTTEPTAEPLYLDDVKLHLRVDSSDDDTLIESMIKAARHWCEDFQGRSYVLKTIQLKRDNFENLLILPRPPLRSVISIQYLDSDGATQTLSTDVYDLDTTREPGLVYLAYDQIWPIYRSERHAITVNYKTGYVTPFTANASTDVLTAIGHIYADDDIVRLTNSGGALPAGLVAETDYYVRDTVAATSLKLAASKGGTAIDITDAGTGYNYFGVMPDTILAAIKLLVGHLYEHREDVSDTKLEQIPFGIKSILYTNRIVPV